MFKKAFRINGGHAARASSDNCLSVDAVLDIAASKHAGNFGARALALGFDIAFLIERKGRAK